MSSPNEAMFNVTTPLDLAVRHFLTKKIGKMLTSSKPNLLKFTVEPLYGVQGSLRAKRKIESTLPTYLFLFFLLRVTC